MPDVLPASSSPPRGAAAASPLQGAPLIALLGSPNCGKTALFNAMTGSRQKVANYHGVTVERKEGAATAPDGMALRILDLPGTYSLNPRSPDEEITRDVLLGRHVGQDPPDLVVCVVDATHLQRNLRLVLEVNDLGRPVVLAVNMMDIAERRGWDIDLEALSRELGVPVIGTVAVRGQGVPELLTEATRHLNGTPRALPDAWAPPTPQTHRHRHRQIEEILSRASRRRGEPSVVTQRLDRVLLHPVGGLVLLAALFFLIFQAVFDWARLPQDGLQWMVDHLHGAVNAHMADGPLRSLLTDGVISGVGSVLVFAPQILILFFFILVLEDSGYMARAAFLMDRLMGGVGLHGRAFIPLLSSFACAVPGIMATRTIENRRDRLVTILIAPLMTCSARLPVYGLIIAAFIPNRVIAGPIRLQGVVLFTLYAAGAIAALLAAFVMRRTAFRGPRPPFLMELPDYKMPNLRNLALGLWERLKIFLSRAGGLILSAMIVLWFVSSYPKPPLGSTEPAINFSIAGMLGHLLLPIFAPIGFTWQMVVALIPGLAAREVAVAALGTVYSLDVKEGADAALAGALSLAWSLPSALAFLAWYVFAPQCISTLAVVKRETNSWKWPVVMAAAMFMMAWLAAFITYHVTVALT